MNALPLQNPRVAVVGGGLAGLAAGCALASSGFRVTLFERRPYLGGRASSYQHPGTGEVVDNCQHVLLGCCTNLIQFYERLGVENKIRWYDRLTFLEPGGRESVMEPSSLPARGLSEFFGQAFHCVCNGIACSGNTARFWRLILDLAAPSRPDEASHRAFLEAGANKRVERGA
jgi:uncharacterized protein with NAD-binding domain and iron-sulfur cluster